jgi:hypothetical protein
VVIVIQCVVVGKLPISHNTTSRCRVGTLYTTSTKVFRTILMDNQDNSSTAAVYEGTIVFLEENNVPTP